MNMFNTYTAFMGTDFFGQGSLSEIILKIKKYIGTAENTNILIFSDLTGKAIDFNFQGSLLDVQKRLDVFVSENSTQQITGPGRPKLGVISREISLLPAHWEWLATQPGGSSAVIRKLIDEARKKSEGSLSIKQIQERVHRFTTAMAGDLQGYEEALRALYRKDEDQFLIQMGSWPSDIRDHVINLSKPIFK